MRNLPDPQRVLIVNPFGIGDVLFSTPFIAALKERYPSVAISYIGNVRTISFLMNDPRLSKVFSYERDEFVAVYKRSPLAFVRKWFDLVKELRAQHFDIAFDLSLGSPLALALVLAGIPRRVGYDYKGRGRWLTHKVSLKGYDRKHVAEYYLGLIPAVADIISGPVDAGDKTGCYPISMFFSPSDESFADAFMRAHGLCAGAFVVIHPGGGASWGKGAGLKRWPAVNFAKLADKMIEKEGLPIILMGDKNEIVLCEEVAGVMEHKPIILAGQASITQAAALMRLSRFVVANDGGSLHAAVAAGAKTVSIFGPVDPLVYGPYPAEGHIIVQKGLPCQPCYRIFRMSDCTHSACLRALSSDDVFEAVKKLTIDKKFKEVIR